MEVMRICSARAQRMGLIRMAGGSMGSGEEGRWRHEYARGNPPCHSYLRVNTWWKTETGWRREPSQPVGGLNSWHFRDNPVFVVIDDHKGVLSSLQPVPPFFQHQLNGEQLPISNNVVRLSWGKHPGEVSTRVESDRLSVVLRQHCSHASQGIHFHYEWELEFWMGEDGAVQKASWRLL